MNTALEQLSPNIPLVVTPANMSSPELDELSSITYLSYFIKVGGPGYLATLDWTQAQMSDEAITNFSVSYYLSLHASICLYFVSLFSCSLSLRLTGMMAG